MSEESQEFLTPDAVNVRPLQQTDIDQVVPILQEWVRDAQTGQVIEAEVQDILGKMEASLEEGSDRTYYTAELDGEILGVMALAAPSPEMIEIASTDNPVEIVNAFVSGKAQGKGVGKKLLESLAETAKESGFTELIVNSGPRYKNAWGFYTKNMGEPVRILRDQYGPGLDAPVWSKAL